ncbi:unnamed protein product [Cladocopium goreaui]|uniref:Probable phosphoglycerate mutase GpmB (PGAM ) (Phosphoglyceromutase) n=1 Tax=Cladocopium goreaui TaxID=2562237 RepID=A0A9P1DAD4_9DINO|nr:unnamed protein product [Cladocopium goreaui]
MAAKCFGTLSQMCCGGREGGRQSRIYLIRHGETVWNADRRIQGQLDIDINDTGMKQAQGVANALDQLGILRKIDAVASSDLQRASRTADIIAAACERSPPRSLDPQLREIGYGKLQGSQSDNEQSKLLQQSTFEAWINGDLSKGFPEGETGAEFFERIVQGLRDAARLGKAVVVVAHGGLIRWSAAQMASSQEEAKRLVKSPIVNCCCSTLVYDHDLDLFTAEEWFVDLQKAGGLKAKDDTG